MKYTIEIDSTGRDFVEAVLLFNGVVKDRLYDNTDIVFTVQRILEKHKLSISDVSKVIPNKGPGSFTGIKRGITVANVLNWTLGCEDVYSPKYGGEPNINKI